MAFFWFCNPWLVLGFRAERAHKFCFDISLQLIGFLVWETARHILWEIASETQNIPCLAHFTSHCWTAYTSGIYVHHERPQVHLPLPSILLWDVDGLPNLSSQRICTVHVYFRLIKDIYKALYKPLQTQDRTWDVNVPTETALLPVSFEPFISARVLPNLVVSHHPLKSLQE